MVLTFFIWEAWVVLGVTGFYLIQINVPLFTTGFTTFSLVLAHLHPCGRCLALHLMDSTYIIDMPLTEVGLSIGFTENHRYYGYYFNTVLLVLP